ncbi:MAG: hypothetical protein ACOWWM_11345 [Desulfobacterales bacterium]
MGAGARGKGGEPWCSYFYHEGHEGHEEGLNTVFAFMLFMIFMVDLVFLLRWSEGIEGTG